MCATFAAATVGSDNVLSSFGATSDDGTLAGVMVIDLSAIAMALIRARRSKSGRIGLTAVRPLPVRPVPSNSDLRYPSDDLPIDSRLFL